ncbi:MAG TPA: serine hydrolase, partial [Acetobacteraceae bacterium]
MSDIDAILRRAVDQGDVPGVVAIAATPDAVIYEGAFGRRSLAEPARMDMETVFRIASMTK